MAAHMGPNTPPGEGEHEHSWSLEMPFVVCVSQGGPFDDHAFVAGARFHELRMRLEIGRPDSLSVYEMPELLPQLDLLAMAHGYALTHQPWPEAPEDWELVTFTLPVKEPDDD